MCSKLICKRAQLCTVCSPDADPVVMVSFVHQPSESVRKWRGGRGKGEDPGYCIHQHYLRRAYCMPSTLWLPRISEPICQRAWPHILAFLPLKCSRKSSLDVVLCPFHHTAPSLPTASPTSLRTRITGPRAPSALAHSITSSLGSGLTSFALLVVFPMNISSSGEIVSSPRLGNHPYNPPPPSSCGLQYWTLDKCVQHTIIEPSCLTVAEKLWVDWWDALRRREMQQGLPGDPLAKTTPGISTVRVRWWKLVSALEAAPCKQTILNALEKLFKENWNPKCPK